MTLTPTILLPDYESRFSKETAEYLRKIEQMAASAVGFTVNFPVENEVYWEISGTDPQRDHNRWINLLTSAYWRKNALYLNSLIGNINAADYLGYAQSARALIELTATLRYYMKNKYEPMMHSGPVDLAKMLLTHEKHFHGKSFDWGSLLEGDFESLLSSAKLKVKANKARKAEREIILRELQKAIGEKQTNTMTCLMKWGADEPGVVIAYDAFCDLVHPNFGSNFVIASIDDDRVAVGTDSGRSLGEDVVNATLPWFVAAYAEFGPLMLRLSTMKYQVDEIQPAPL